MLIRKYTVSCPSGFKDVAPTNRQGENSQKSKSFTTHIDGHVILQALEPVLVKVNRGKTVLFTKLPYTHAMRPGQHYN